MIFGVDLTEQVDFHDGEKPSSPLRQCFKGVYLLLPNYLYFSNCFRNKASVFFFIILVTFALGRIERVIIAGVKTEPSSAALTVVGSQTESPLAFVYDAAAGLVTVRKPDVCVAEDFDIQLSFYSTS